jgi:hypothetical protein
MAIGKSNFGSTKDDKKKIQTVMIGIGLFHPTLLCFGQITLSCCIVGISLHIVQLFHFLKNYPAYFVAWPILTALIDR